MFSHFIFTVSRWWYFHFQETEAQRVPCTRFAYQEVVRVGIKSDLRLQSLYSSLETKAQLVLWALLFYIQNLFIQVQVT